MLANKFIGSHSLNTQFFIFYEDLADDLVEVRGDNVDVFNFFLGD